MKSGLLEDQEFKFSHTAFFVLIDVNREKPRRLSSIVALECIPVRRAGGETAGSGHSNTPQATSACKHVGSLTVAICAPQLCAAEVLYP